jgi:hypothetical protein
MPLTAKEINFTSSAGSFDGNSLLIDNTSTVEKITVKAVLKADPAIFKEITIYIKKSADNERLKTSEEVMQAGQKNRKQ